MIRHRIKGNSSKPYLGLERSQTLQKSNVQKPYVQQQGVFSGRTFFYVFEKLNSQCKVDIVFKKSFYLNGNAEFYEIILALLENFFIILRIFFVKIKLQIAFFIKYSFNSNTQFNNIFFHLCCRYIIKSGGTLSTIIIKLFCSFNVQDM